MTDETTRTDLHPTDEPDGTTATAASLRPVGESVTAPQDGDGDLDTGVDDFDTADEDEGAPQRVGYDPADVSGDTSLYRPES